MYQKESKQNLLNIGIPSDSRFNYLVMNTLQHKLTSLCTICVVKNAHIFINITICKYLQNVKKLFRNMTVLEIAPQKNWKSYWQKMVSVVY